MNSILTITDPISVFLIIAIIILFVPIIFQRFNISYLVGYIIIGAIIGPKGLNILLRNSAITLFGTLGLLLIMFISGLEIDIEDFRKNKIKSLIFGLITFTIPLILGILTSYYILKFNIVSSILIASMYSSHTLITYPIISKLKLSKNEAVNITIGGTIICNILALIILSVITSSYSGVVDNYFAIKLILKYSLFLLFSFLLLPVISKWFLSKIDDSDGFDFIFVLIVILGNATIARLAGIEPIIGAFLAGLILNEEIDINSKLYERISFTSNSLFIPFFLISVGMLIDYKVIFGDGRTILTSIVMILCAVSGKLFSAILTGKILKYNTNEIFVIFGLSNSQAASTLAAVTIGYNLGILDIYILNGTILMILFTIFISGIFTDKYGRRLAMSLNITDESINKKNILVSISNPLTSNKLLEVAYNLSNGNASLNILSIILENKDSDKNMKNQKEIHSKIIEKFKTNLKNINSIIRLDINVIGGILRVAKEIDAELLILGWSSIVNFIDYIFEPITKRIIEVYNKRLIICNFEKDLNDYKNLKIFCPPNLTKDYSFSGIRDDLINFKNKLKVPVEWYFLSNLDYLDVKTNENIKVRQIKDLKDILMEYENNTSNNDLVLFIVPRRNTVSWDKQYKTIVNKIILRNKYKNIIILYPELSAEAVSDSNII